METTAPIIPPPPPGMWVLPDDEPGSALEEREAARHLGLALALVVAVGCDAIALTVMALIGSGASPDDVAPSDLVTIVQANLWLLLPVLAAAPWGWLLAPRLIRNGGRSIVGTVSLMAIMTMLLGDAIVSTTWGILATNGVTADYGASDGMAIVGVPFIAVLGAIFYGPFVVLFATLPAAAVWVLSFRIAWARRTGTGASVG
jgi:hypothetical protein